MNTNNSDHLAQYAMALSHPIRIEILKKLANASCCYHGDFSEEFNIAKSTLSQHLKVLKEANLIKGEINPPKTKYCINTQAWQQAQQIFDVFFKQNICNTSCD